MNRFVPPSRLERMTGPPLPIKGPFSAAPPLVGTISPGEILVDIQSRTMWAGVSSDVDAAEAILLSDIVSLQEDDAANLAEAKAYTDQQIQTRAPINHTHTSSQITDFNAAVNAAVAFGPTSFVKGMIIMWSGSLVEIGVGPLAQWALCDGTNATPDLRDRFIIGAGNKAVGAKNSPTSLITGLAGAHSHQGVVTPTYLTVDQMPHHAHGVADYTHTHGVNDPGHQHIFSDRGTGDTYASPGGYGDYANRASSGKWTDARVTGVYLSYSGANIAIYGNGGSNYHVHYIYAEADHQHSIPSITENVPYYALAYIMKL